MFPHIQFEAPTDPVASRRAIADADAVIGGPWNDELLNEARALRWVQSTLAGVDDMPLTSFEKRHIALTTFRGVSAPNLSEHVLALMLSFARGIPEFVRRQDKALWLPGAQRPDIFELGGQTVGILGFGALGTAIGQKCHALGMRVCVACRSERAMPAFVSKAYRMDELGQMLGTIDHLVLALPSTPQTRGLMGQENLAALQRGAYIYNIGRGDCIDSQALIGALQSGHLRGAGLDVTSPEPLPADSPLWAMPNVIITGHTSGSSPKRWHRGMEIIVENIARFARGESLVNRVNLAGSE